VNSTNNARHEKVALAVVQQIGDRMIKLLTSQPESDRQFNRWVSALLSGSSEVDGGWVIDGTGISFSNYGNGPPGQIRNSVMLGVDRSLGTGVVKVVRPDVAQQDRGKLTAIGKDESGRIVLLRQGWLQKNRLSRSIRDDFDALSGLAPVLRTPGGRTPRTWHLVADLGGTDEAIVRDTVEFVNACALARSSAGGAAPEVRPEDGYRLGTDEKGQTVKVLISGGEREVLRLQGYVWTALKKLLGDRMTKPGRHGFEADAMVEIAGLLIEIKTGVSAHDIYEAVGQLSLYPSLLKLPDGLRPVLLVPEDPRLRPQMAAALARAGIAVYFYSIRRSGKKLRIGFTADFLSRCAKESFS
jgi:hypothetical protein